MLVVALELSIVFGLKFAIVELHEFKVALAVLQMIRATRCVLGTPLF